jgi:hypothetical protein
MSEPDVALAVTNPDLSGLAKLTEIDLIAEILMIGSRQG